MQHFDLKNASLLDMALMLLFTTSMACSPEQHTSAPETKQERITPPKAFDAEIATHHAEKQEEHEIPLIKSGEERPPVVGPTDRPDEDDFFNQKSMDVRVIDHSRLQEIQWLPSPFGNIPGKGERPLYERLSEPGAIEPLEQQPSEKSP